METPLNSLRKLELILLGVIFGTWNNVSTLYNAHTLFAENQIYLSILSIFFFCLPGLVSSTGFLCLHFLDHREIGRFPPPKVFGIYFLLLLFHPICTIALALFVVTRNKYRNVYVVLKLLEGFLDDGPQFMLRFTIVVLYGLRLEKNHFVFIVSCLTSLISLIFAGLKCNERESSRLLVSFLAFPLFLTSVLSRSLTLSVFLSETTGRIQERVGGIVVLGFLVLTNILAFKFCAQDGIRSIVFGLCSLLLPVGYNNDAFTYQKPHQSLLSVSSSSEENQNESQSESSMSSGVFLLIHGISNSIFYASITLYLHFTRALTPSSGDASSFPIILTLLPSLLFTLSRSVLMFKIKSTRLRRLSQRLPLYSSCFLAALAYGSFFPLFLWTLFLKTLESL